MSGSEPAGDPRPGMSTGSYDSDAPIQVERNHAELQVSDWLSAQVEGTSAARVSTGALAPWFTA
jgi:hypothetical protein